ncbi:MULTISPECIES: lipopolysaccharide transport periplasmic protein LptA [unclassified Thioalkalivibrio]|uniref:lipopolysaccharide transport periplasmic protein LptA n=1 Tax=unclassified Thioalkalivibrio TaxID=2621013 RepID=UPI00035FC909|nr:MULTISPECIES: lipopolysaccharide transport periplasmic protein LptA [unclassified Thioalkalivibrio]
MIPIPNSRRLPSLLAAAILLLALLAAPAMAQQGSGPALPVEITADHAEMDERQGLGTYTGDVIVIRGDMTLEADTVYVRTRDRRPYEMEAHGEPARLESPDPETGEMRIATALRIDYLLNEDRMILTDQAHVITAREEARGKRITYDLTTDVIEAERGEGDSERVRITIQPRDNE